MVLIPALIDLYSLVVIAAVIFSWIPGAGRNAVGMLVYRLTEPALAPIRRMLPVTGGIDFSPMVLLLGLRLLKRLI